MTSANDSCFDVPDDPKVELEAAGVGEGGLDAAERASVDDFTGLSGAGRSSTLCFRGVGRGGCGAPSVDLVGPGGVVESCRWTKSAPDERAAHAVGAPMCRRLTCCSLR